MEFFETIVPLDEDDMDHNDNQEKEARNHNHNGNPFQSDAAAAVKKKSELVSEGAESGDRVESVAMDLISCQPESPADRHDESHHHHHSDTTAVISSFNAMSSDPQSIRPASSSSPASSSHHRGGDSSRQQADPTLSSGSSMYQRLLRVPVNGDKRLASSYTSFLLGRVLCLAGSISLLVGLFFRFIFMTNDGVAKSIPFTIIGVSIFMIALGALLVIWSARKSSIARKRHDQVLIPNHPKSRDGRPGSGLSSGSSFH